MSTKLKAGTATSGAVIDADTSGVLELVSGSSSQYTVTVPQVSGTIMVSGNMPAFSAYASANQTFNAGAETKVNFDTEVFDTNSNFASSRFTPTVAGYYQINACVSAAMATGYVSIFKNGGAYQRGFQTQSAVVSFIVTSIVYLNGSTDYVEIYLGNQTGSSTTVNNLSTLTYVTGAMVRAA